MAPYRPGVMAASVSPDGKPGNDEKDGNRHDIPGRRPRLTQLAILEYPDPRLKRVARPVTVFDERLRKLVADIAETMYAAPGVGLAATQVDVHERILVVDVSEAKDALHVFINPELVWASEETALCEEGCLSVPGVFDMVRRPARVRVRAMDVEGRPFELDCEGTLAVCVQHEMDHLEGRVFVEYLSPLKQTRIRARMRKRHARRA
jgi:peptide deformylase